MFELFDPERTYTLPSGRSADAEYLSGDFPMCGSQPYACEVYAGVLCSMVTLDSLKMSYGVTEGDPAAAIDAINSAIVAEAQSRSDASKVMEQLDALTSAFDVEVENGD